MADARRGMSWGSYAVDEIGEEIYDLLREIYPFHRSISGEGVRRDHGEHRLRDFVPLGERGLYRSIDGGSNREAALLWVLNLSDGSNDLLAISNRSGLSFPAVREAADALEDPDLLRRQ